jgi:preprotein translocase subunit SecG
MYLLFVILIVIAALLMIFIVLIQESKGGGLTSNFQNANQLAGVHKTTDFIEKATWGLAAAMVVLSVLCAAVAPKSHGEESAVENQIENPLTNPATQQKFGVSQQAAPEGTAKTAAPAAEGAAPAAPAAPTAPAAPAQ